MMPSSELAEGARDIRCAPTSCGVIAALEDVKTVRMKINFRMGCISRNVKQEPNGYALLLLGELTSYGRDKAEGLAVLLLSLDLDNIGGKTINSRPVR